MNKYEEAIKAVLDKDWEYQDSIEELIIEAIREKEARDNNK